MSAKKKKPAAPASASAPASIPVSVPGDAAATTAPAEEFRQRHPKIANALFAALCVYVAMLCLLALDQTFHWGIFGPKIPPLP